MAIGIAELSFSIHLIRRTTSAHFSELAFLLGHYVLTRIADSYSLSFIVNRVFLPTDLTKTKQVCE